MRRAKRKALLVLLEHCMHKEISLPPEFTDLSIVMNLPLPTWSNTRSDGRDVHPKIRGLLNVAIPKIKWK